MLGIDNKPYIDCSEFLDLQTLIDLEIEICSGLALSNIKSGIYGPGIVNAEKYGNYLFMSKEIDNKPELHDEYRWKRMNQEQKRLFLKLYKNLYSPNNSVYLKDSIDYTSLQAYLKKGSSDYYKYCDNIIHFPRLKIWLENLVNEVFEEFGRTLFFIHEHDCELLIHRDGTQQRPHKNEFLWINPMGVKSFFIYDEINDKKHYVNCKAAFFNDLDMHGGERNDSMTWTLRIDGVFTNSFREKIGINHINMYSNNAL